MTFKTLPSAVALVVAMAWASQAMAEEKRFELAVGNLYCPACTYILERTLTKVQGIMAVQVIYETSTVRVVYDDARVDVAAIKQATASIGFPSKIIRGGKDG